MDQGYVMLGFIVIVILYAVLGVMAAVGIIHIFQRVFTPKSEQIFYGVLLVFIAMLYLAFMAYFGAWTAWRLEATAILAFAALGLVGARLPIVLAVGYCLHGLWDLLHELRAHGAVSAFESGELTAIPLAYGALCLAIDFFLAAYFYKRRAQWSAAWKAPSPAAMN
jgi:hypothetical protein